MIQKVIFSFLLVGFIFCLPGYAEETQTKPQAKETTVAQGPDVKAFELLKSGSFDFYFGGVKHFYANILSVNLKVASYYRTKIWKLSDEESSDRRNYVQFGLYTSMYEYANELNLYPHYNDPKLVEKEQEKLLGGILDPFGGLLCFSLASDTNVGGKLKNGDERNLFFRLKVNASAKIVAGINPKTEKDFSDLVYYFKIGINRPLKAFSLDNQDSGPAWVEFGAFCTLASKELMNNVFNENINQNLLGLYADFSVTIEKNFSMNLTMHWCINNQGFDRLAKPVIKLTFKLEKKEETKTGDDTEKEKAAIAKKNEIQKVDPPKDAATVEKKDDNKKSEHSEDTKAK